MNPPQAHHDTSHRKPSQPHSKVHVPNGISKDSYTKKDRNKDDRNPDRAARALQLTSFVYAKSQGTQRAIQKYRDKKQEQFLHRAKKLKSYRKVMKQEGYEPGWGASRKRNLSSISEQKDANEEKKERNQEKVEGKQILPQDRKDKNTWKNQNEHAAKKESQTAPTGETEDPKRKRRKTDPFQKAKQKAEEIKQEKEEIKKQLEEKRKRNDKNRFKRKLRAKQMMKRTSKTGQPVMKNVIQGMLEKIQHDMKHS